MQVTSLSINFKIFFSSSLKYVMLVLGGGLYMLITTTLQAISKFSFRISMATHLNLVDSVISNLVVYIKVWDIKRETPLSVLVLRILYS